MRRLMTGYAVTFNLRHRRSGHLFQNRYKSVVCEEDTYLLELIRYIHLNPLRAKLVEDLESLDKYQWSGHSVLIGKKENPLVPEIPPFDEKDKYLAGKTIEDVLQFFGKSLKEARRRYGVFVEKGIKQGRREDLQGGGLIRSSGGDKAGLLGLKKEEREKGDPRILGSGDFVSDVLQHANEDADRKKGHNISLTELISRVCKEFDIKIGALMLDVRRAPYTQAKAIISYFSIHELGYRGSDVAKALNLSRASVSKSKSRAKKLIDGNQHLWDLLKQVNK